MHFLPFLTIKTLTLRMDHAKFLDVLTSLPVSRSILPRAVYFATSHPANHAICSFIDSSGYASGPIRRCLFIDYIINLNMLLKSQDRRKYFLVLTEWNACPFYRNIQEFFLDIKHHILPKYPGELNIVNLDQEKSDKNLITLQHFTTLCTSQQVTQWNCSFF